ncbi:MFS transporter [Sandarakinorhabdus sp.]|uniref:MFS transporter n=1 Tax=Sandarakinorhabdus sp. TaxID=1916663 RepID=UPI00286E7E9D|nr:MFS transporter [Sandarakinorhabdus sp.]
MTSASSVSSPVRRSRVPTITRIAYGLGSVANGVRNHGLGYLLLLFYSQVIGLDARLVGLAITIGLVVDAFTDTGIGYWSDNLRSRWGRRHPLMYLAALPTGLVFFLIWNPPAGWSQMALFWYVLALTIFVRFVSSLYEVPNAALAAELTDDYVERSSLISLQQYFAWSGGTLMAVLVFGFIFPAFATAQIPNGQFNREAYAFYGIIGSAVIFAAMMAATLGTHSQIKYLRPAPPKRPMTPRRMFTEVFETLNNRAFLALFMVAAFGLLATGVSTTLTYFINSFFWGFTSEQTAMLAASVLVSAAIGGLVAPLASRIIGKRRGAFSIGMLAFVGAPLPIMLRLTGVLPAESDGFVFWFVLSVQTFDLGLIIAFQILAASMLADLVEPAELKTGRRSEGLFAASTSFLGKLVQGFGVTIASFVLTFAGIKTGTDPSQVPADAIWRLGAYYVPTVLALWMAMMAALTFYKRERSDHEASLTALAAQRAVPAAAE